MPFFRRLILGIFLCHLKTFSAAADSVEDRVLACNSSRFQARSVAIESIRPASVNFTTKPAAKKFRTAIAQGAAGGVNFAGRYTVVLLGEGSPVCYHFAIIETATGKIVYYSPSDGRNQKIYQECARPTFKADSTLLIFDAGCESDRNFWSDAMNKPNWRSWGMIPIFINFQDEELVRDFFPYSQYDPALPKN